MPPDAQGESKARSLGVTHREVTDVSSILGEEELDPDFCLLVLSALGSPEAAVAQSERLTWTPENGKIEERS